VETRESYEAALAALIWQIELGADEAIADAPLDRYALSAHAMAAQAKAAEAAAAPPVPATAKPPPPVRAPEVDPVAEARAAAEAASDLGALAAAMEAFEHCELKRGARSFVFCDGAPAARMMIVGEAPGREEDRAGLPFVGRAGQLLDRMLAAIGLDRRSEDPAMAVYICNVLPWRPPENRKPEALERAMFKPFVEKHIALAAPEVVVLMGNTPCETLLGRSGITRIRGEWAEVLGRPALPTFHPAYLLRTPQAKREAWLDLQQIRSRLESAP